MTERKNDLAPLFKQFGQKQVEYQEISRDTNAQAAGERWPLLKNLDLQARTHVPELSNAQRQERLDRTDLDAKEIELPVAKVKAQLGSALNRLSDLKRTEVVRASVSSKSQATPPREEVHFKAAPTAQPAGSSFRHEQPAQSSGIFGKHAQDNGGTQAFHRAEPERNESGLFSRKSPNEDTRQTFTRSETEARGSGDGLFSRNSQPAESSPVFQRAQPDRKETGLFNRGAHPTEESHTILRSEPEKKGSGLFGRNAQSNDTPHIFPRAESERKEHGLFGKQSHAVEAPKTFPRGDSERNQTGFLGKKSPPPPAAKEDSRFRNQVDLRGKQKQRGNPAANQSIAAKSSPSSNFGSKLGRRKPL